MTELVSLEEPTESESRPRLNRVKILLTVLGASVLVASLTLGPTIARMLTQRSPTLTAPPTVGTHTRDDSEAAKLASSDLVTALSAEFDSLDTTVDAVYLDPSGNASNSIIIAAATIFLFNPERELDTVIGFGGTSEDISQMGTVEAGPLGGTMKCGESGSGPDALAICGWADHGSIAIALFPGRSKTDAAPLMLEFRTAIEKR